MPQPQPSRSTHRGISMTKQYLKPLALAVSLALTVSACGKQDATPADTPAPPASPAPAAAGSTAAADSKSIFDVSELGAPPEALPDSNHFVHAKGGAPHPIPNERTRWGGHVKPSRKESWRERESP